MYEYTVREFLTYDTYIYLTNIAKCLVWNPVVQCVVDHMLKCPVESHSKSTGFVEVGKVPF